MPETVKIPLETFTLQEIPAAVWHLLESGVRSGADPFHTPVLATQSNNGPAQRTVVLRHVEANERIIACHTDRRSAKAREVLEDSRVSWLFYDSKRKLQLYLAGNASLHTGGIFFDRCWSQASENARACYNTALVPGQPIETPPVAPAKLRTDLEAALARDRFAVLACRVTFLEWLYLSWQGHRRAQFVWRDEQLSASWVTP